jgi:hypothetical protein
MFRTSYTINGERHTTGVHTGDDLYAIMVAENANHIRVEGKTFIVTIGYVDYVVKNIKRNRVSPSK